MKVDVVYTWVDGGNPEYWEVVRQYATAKKDMNPERFRDDYQMLRYSMRALHQFAGDWVGKIYVLTARPQCPPWLNCDHPDVIVKHHDEFFRDPSVLPTFSCLNIEPEMHNLPCSDPFLYFNDDYLLGAPVRPQQFCDHDGNIRVFGTLIGERFPWRIRQGGISLGFTEHTPIWIDKTAYQADAIIPVGCDSEGPGTTTGVRLVPHPRHRSRRDGRLSRRTRCPGSGCCRRPPAAAPRSHPAPRPPSPGRCPGRTTAGAGSAPRPARRSMVRPSRGRGC